MNLLLIASLTSHRSGKNVQRNNILLASFAIPLFLSARDKNAHKMFRKVFTSSLDTRCAKELRNKIAIKDFHMNCKPRAVLLLRFILNLIELVGCSIQNFNCKTCNRIVIEVFILNVLCNNLWIILRYFII
jgi:hypothetical protein